MAFNRELSQFASFVEVGISSVGITTSVGIGTTAPTSRLHVVGDGLFTGIITASGFSGGPLSGSNGNFSSLYVSGVTTSVGGFTGNLNSTGVSTVGSLSIGATQVISSGRQLQNIASLDATTTATIESAIANAPNTFSDLQVTGISTFVNGPVLVGSATSTGTASQALQIGSAANPLSLYVSGGIGIGITNHTQKLTISNAAKSLEDGSLFAISSSDTTNPFQLTITRSSNLVSNPYYSIQSVEQGVNFRNLVLNRSGGNVAIGSTLDTGTPSQPLQVTGGAYVSGNTGIGTTNPTSRLHVVGDALVTGITTTASLYITGSSLSPSPNGSINVIGVADTTQYTPTGTSNGYPDAYKALYLRNNSGTDGAACLITLSANNSGGFYNWWYLGSVATSDANRAGNFVIGSRNSGSNYSERIRINSSGNVGIGTTVPQAILHTFSSGEVARFQATSNPYINFYSGSSNTAYIQSRTTDLRFASIGNIPITFFPNDVEKVRIDVGGNVIIGSATSTGTASQPLQVTGGAYISGNTGIGTTNPGARLHVVPSSTSSAGIFSGTTSDDMVHITQTGTGNALVVEDDANPDATPFVITGIGSVGIATTNPTTTLQVNGTTKIETQGTTQDAWFITQDSKTSATNVGLLVQPDSVFNFSSSETTFKSYYPTLLSSAITSSNESYAPVLSGLSNYLNGAGTTANARLSLYGSWNRIARNSTTDISSYGSGAFYSIISQFFQGISVSQSVVSGAVYNTYNVTAIQKATATTIANTYNQTSIGISPNQSASSTNTYGVYNVTTIGATSGTGIGTLTNYYGTYTRPTVQLTGQLTNYYGLYLDTPSVTGTLTNRWSIYSSDTASPMVHMGNVGIATTNPTSELSIGSEFGVDTTTTAITTTTATSVIGISTTLFRSARIQVQISQGSSYQASDVLLIHNGSTSNIIEYGTLATDSTLATFSTDISSNTARLLVSMGSATSATVKAVAQRMTV